MLQEVVQMLWTPDSFMQFVPATQAVHAWLARDESFLCTTHGGDFLRHLRGDCQESLYRAKALPMHAWTADESSRYPVRDIAQRVLDLRCISMHAIHRSLFHPQENVLSAHRLG
jgi:hypothetical protein